MSTGKIGEKINSQREQLNTSSCGKPGNRVNSELAFEIFFNLVFAIPIVIYRGFKFVLKKMRKTT